jgi:hypothetical protein
MSTSIEIEVESESEYCDCCKDCKMSMGAKPEESKDALLAELKKLLAETGSNGLADRQMKIDELISKISELGD